VAKSSQGDDAILKVRFIDLRAIHRAVQRKLEKDTTWKRPAMKKKSISTAQKAVVDELRRLANFDARRLFDTKGRLKPLWRQSPVDLRFVAGFDGPRRR
jgi:hypothetical protein